MKKEAAKAQTGKPIILVKFSLQVIIKIFGARRNFACGGRKPAQHFAQKREAGRRTDYRTRTQTRELRSPTTTVWRDVAAVRYVGLNGPQLHLSRRLLY